jgi:hypothetical protein
VPSHWPVYNISDSEFCGNLKITWYYLPFE